MRPQLLILVVLTAFLYCLSAQARDVGKSPTKMTEAASGLDHGKIFVLKGRLGPGSYDRFRISVTRVKPDLIVLDGPGGRLLEAILIGREIRRRGMATAIRKNKTCASACAVVYLSGRKKYAGQGAAIGLHSASDGQGHRDSDANRFMLNYLGRVGVPATVLRSVLTAAPDTMRWLDQRDRNALNIRAF
jgi:hypothetical protein